MDIPTHEILNIAIDSQTVSTCSRTPASQVCCNHRLFFSVCCAKHVSSMLFLIRLNTFHFHYLRQSIGGVEERGNGQ